MTLLESIVAFILLAVVGVACLDLAQGATSLQFRSREWSAAVAAAETAMAETLAGAPPSLERKDAPAVAVTRTPYRAGLELVSVTVSLSGGRRFTLERVAPPSFVARSAR